MSIIDKNIFHKLKERMKAKFPVLLEGYLRDAQTYLVTIETNIPDGSLPPLIEAAHSLKSASGLLGIVQVHKTAEELEYAAKDLKDNAETNLHSLDPLYANLQNAFSEAQGDLLTELEKAKAA